MFPLFRAIVKSTFTCSFSITGVMNGPSSKTTIFGLQCSKTLPVWIFTSHFQFIISYFYLFSVVISLIAVLKVVILTHLLLRYLGYLIVSNTCIACWLKFYIRKLNKQAFLPFLPRFYKWEIVLLPVLVLIKYIRWPSLGLKTSNP